MLLSTVGATRVLAEVAHAVERNRQQYGPADKAALPEGVDAEKAQAVADHFDEGSANDGARCRAHAACKGSAADNRCGNDLKLKARANVGGDRPQPAGLNDAGNACRKGGNHVNRNLDRAHGNAGQSRCMFIAADGIDIAAKPGPAQDKAGDQRQNDHVKHRIGNAEEPGAAAQCQQQIMVGPELEHHRVARGHHGQASGNGEHAKCHHKGRHADIGDEYAVNKANQKGRGNCRGDAHFNAVTRMHGDTQHHATETEHRAHRQVDAAGNDDERHAQGDDGHEGDVARDVVEVLRGVEGVRVQGQEHAGEDDRDKDPEGLAAQFFRKPALLFLFNCLGHCACRRRHVIPSKY